MTAPSREELIGRLRARVSADWQDKELLGPELLYKQAADALEADQKRIAELTGALALTLGKLRTCRGRLETMTFYEPGCVPSGLDEAIASVKVALPSPPGGGG